MYQVKPVPSDNEFKVYFQVQQYLEEEAVDQYIAQNVKRDRLIDQPTFDQIVSAFQKRKDWSADEYNQIIEAYTSVTQDFSVGR